MQAYSPPRKTRLIAAGVAIVALTITATMAVSYARPLGKSGYGNFSTAGYGGYGTSGIQGR